jgi:hypothetical protein
MTVGQLNRTMSNGEFVGWQMYYARKAQRRELSEKMAKYNKAG